MKKRSISLVLILAMLCSMFPLTASAGTSGDSASMTVNFTIEEPETQDPGGSDSSSGPHTGTYLVNIPSSVELNYESSIVLTTSYNNIADNERLVVSIDGKRTLSPPENKFYLYYSEGDTTYDRIECVLKRGSSSDFSTPPSEVLTGPDDAVVATFKNSSNGADTYGWLAFEPSYTQENDAGTYTGTIYFKVEVIDD
jgi:hypothetical protein